MRCNWCVVVPALSPQRRRCLPTNPTITDTKAEEESQMNYRPDTTETTVRMGTIAVEGLNIFSREAGKPGSPKLVLLHGFTSSSHQYRNLIPALADTFHVIAMDYPGFGNRDRYRSPR